MEYDSAIKGTLLGSDCKRRECSEGTEVFSGCTVVTLGPHHCINVLKATELDADNR